MLYALRNAIPITNPSALDVNDFLDYLCRQGYAPKVVLSHLSSIKAYHRVMELDFPAQKSPLLIDMVRAIPLTVRRKTKQKRALSHEEVGRLCNECDTRPDRDWLKVAITFAYVGFLRQSNLALPDDEPFDASRHTQVGDVQPMGDAIAMAVKWTKTLQDGSTADSVPMANMKGDPANPVAAWYRYKLARPGLLPSDPLLMALDPPVLRPVSLSQLREAFAEVAAATGLIAGDVTLHSLRRGGAVQAYLSGASVDDIKVHGQWKSDSIWSYLTKTVASRSSVHNMWGSMARASTHL